MLSFWLYIPLLFFQIHQFLRPGRSLFLCFFLDERINGFKALNKCFRHRKVFWFIVAVIKIM